MFCIDDALTQFVQSGVAAVVGTASDDGAPHVSYGWAPRVTGDGGSLDVFLDAARAEQALADLRSNGRVAVTLGDPVSYRSIQFKGRFTGVGPPSEADEVWVATYREAFLVNTSLVGDPPQLIHNMWLDEVVRISMSIERAFDQTPGPVAGLPL